MYRVSTPQLIFRVSVAGPIAVPRDCVEAGALATMMRHVPITVSSLVGASCGEGLNGHRDKPSDT
jgi:hypothetical protein